MLNDTLLRLLEVSIATSFLILPLCLASRRINRRYGAKWKYYIWLLLAVRLMIPINLPAVNGFSIMPDLSSRQQVHTQEQPIQPQAHIGSQPDTVLSQSQEQEQEQSVSEPPYSIGYRGNCVVRWILCFFDLSALCVLCLPARDFCGRKEM